ncbi:MULTISPECIES: DUF4342 domain-containing protein [unclassified Sedimentibacter]|uniref:DUF4342 domain-containing protein n=1 Tax=unclassified Sedimentibacter TaxID=2649220 RepID=UPI0027DF6968|nr:DUF4342 domain-containing protein [Sedimentibacter sp. MB35-C1]WMJ76258.1 DUF4342 domain-containing protein [Sedimentibacter sp. MB35-C1]
MENDKLQKIDDILKRTNTDYSTAKQALEDANGDVLEAIILIENQGKHQSNSQNGPNKGEQILNQLKDILAKGNATKLTIKKNNETIINVPVTAGLIGAFIAPFLSAAGITAALLTQCSVEITQTDGKVVDLGQKVDQGMDAVKDVMQDMKHGAENFRDDIKQGATDFKEDISDSINKNKDEL